MVAGYLTNSSGVQSKSWNVQLNLRPEQFEISEVNDLWVDSENEMLYAACANDIHQINLEDGRVVQSFQGHKDFVHSIDGSDSSIIATASEDGSVKLWDNRQKNATFTIEPSKNKDLQRNHFGAWIGAACVTKVISLINL